MTADILHSEVQPRHSETSASCERRIARIWFAAKAAMQMQSKGLIGRASTRRLNPFRYPTLRNELICILIEMAQEVFDVLLRQQGTHVDQSSFQRLRLYRPRHQYCQLRTNLQHYSHCSDRSLTSIRCLFVAPGLPFSAYDLLTTVLRSRFSSRLLSSVCFTSSHKPRSDLIRISAHLSFSWSVAKKSSGLDGTQRFSSGS